MRVASDSRSTTAVSAMHKPDFFGRNGDLHELFAHYCDHSFFRHYRDKCVRACVARSGSP